MRITSVVALFPDLPEAELVSWVERGLGPARGHRTRLGVPGDRRRPRPPDPVTHAAATHYVSDALTSTIST
jgi:hypothetical protein